MLFYEHPLHLPTRFLLYYFASSGVLAAEDGGLKQIKTGMRGHAC